jgi:hypothetical protein
MTDPILLGLAIAFAFTGYAIGAILRMMPKRSYKMTGTEMMEDSFTAFVLITLISVLVLTANAAASVAYGERSMAAVYDGYYQYVDESKSGAFVILSAVLGVLFAIGGGNTVVTIFSPGSQPLLPLSLVFQSQMGPWIALVQATYALMTVLECVARLLEDKLLVFIAFGCILYAVPRRLTRAAGGALISWPLVFYFGLPLLPAFVNTYGLAASYHDISCTVESCPLVQNLLATATNQGSAGWFSLISNLTSFGVLISDNAARLIWMNLFLPVVFLTILSLAAAGVGKIFGGYVNLLTGA